MSKIKEIRESLNLLTRVVHNAEQEISKLTRDRDAANVAIAFWNIWSAGIAVVLVQL